MRLANEGYKIIGVLILFNLFILTLALYSIIPFIFSFIIFFILMFCINFFRDPKRLVPDGENLIVAPADGKIIRIEKINDSDLGEVQLISIFLSIFNVHVNRMPISGEFTKINYEKGKFLMAFDHKACDENERNEIFIQSKCGVIKLKQITGLIARRIICYASKNTKMSIGERLGFMLFGSRIDLLLPNRATLKVKMGDKVMGKKTIIATFESSE